jgi:NADPH:quinone reductase-like Zn-dependent oxidoreductase
MGSRAEMYPVLELFSCGKLRPVVDEVMPLEKAAEAHRKLESREQFGKIVLKVG